MKTPTSENPETKFNRGAWLTLVIAILLFVYDIASLAYRFTLPTDGWMVNEATEVGFNYTENLMGAPSGLIPGDNVIAVEGIRADDWPYFPASLQQAWQDGATLDYTVIRDRQEMQVPVTLTHWQFGKWLRAKLRAPYELANLLAGYFLLALAVFVFLRRPGNPTAQAFLLFIAVLAANLASILPSGWSGLIDPLARVGIFISNVVFLTIPYAIIRFALVFPRPKPILQRLPWLAYLPIAVGFLLAVLAPYSDIGWLWFLISLVLTVGIIIHNAITMRDAVSRAQILWGLGGILFGIGLITLVLVSTTFSWIEYNEDLINLVFGIALMGMGICLAIAITRYRLFDIEVVIRRTLVYAALTLTLGFVYFGSVILLQGLFEAVSGQQSAVVIVVSTLVIAALFNPLRRRIQNDIDRRFFRRKYDAEKVVEAFSASLREEVDLDDLQEQILSVVEETLQPEHVSLWMKSTPGR